MNYTINSIGSMFTLFFTSEEVSNLDTAKNSDVALFGKYFNAMLEKGVYLAPSQFESLFISSAIEDEHIDQIIKSHRKFLESIAVKTK